MTALPDVISQLQTTEERPQNEACNTRDRWLQGNDVISDGRVSWACALGLLASRAPFSTDKSYHHAGKLNRERGREPEQEKEGKGGETRDMQSPILWDVVSDMDERKQ